MSLFGKRPPADLQQRLDPGTHLVPEPNKCPVCKGWGHVDDPRSFSGREILCGACGGTGKVLGWRVERGS
jgi:DnaJ-class molecular chaperone